MFKSLHFLVRGFICGCEKRETLHHAKFHAIMIMIFIKVSTVASTVLEFFGWDQLPECNWYIILVVVFDYMYVNCLFMNRMKLWVFKIDLKNANIYNNELHDYCNQYKVAFDQESFQFISTQTYLTPPLKSDVYVTGQI